MFNLVCFCNSKMSLDFLCVFFLLSIRVLRFLILIIPLWSHGGIDVNRDNQYDSVRPQIIKNQAFVGHLAINNMMLWCHLQPRHTNFFSVDIEINGVEIIGYVDTLSNVTVVRKLFADYLHLEEINNGQSLRLISSDRSTITVNRVVSMSITSPTNAFDRVSVGALVVDDLYYTVILGTDFHSLTGLRLDFETRRLRFASRRQRTRPIETSTRPHESRRRPVTRQLRSSIGKPQSDNTWPEFELNE